MTWLTRRVFRKGGGPGMSLAQASKRAIQLGGIYARDTNCPKEINKFTVASANALAGSSSWWSPNTFTLTASRIPCRDVCGSRSRSRKRAVSHRRFPAYADTRAL